METGEKPWQAKVKSVIQDTVTGAKHEEVSDEDVRVWRPGPADQDPKPRISETKRSEFAFRPFVTSDPPPLPVSRVPWSRISAGAAALLIFGVTLWLVFRTKIVDAEVSSVNWTYKVHIDRYQVWRRDGWNTDPSAFDVRNEGQRVHHYDKVVSGSHQEPYSESYSCGETCTTTPRTCTSNKNGSATCTGGDRSCYPKTCTRTAYRTVTDYRDEPRYQTWYSWSVWDWGFNRTVAKSGTDMEPGWPPSEQLVAVLQAGEQERQRREELYKITFSASDSKTYSIEPRSHPEFMKFPRGRHARLKVGIAHGVEVLDR